MSNEINLGSTFQNSICLTVIKRSPGEYKVGFQKVNCTVVKFNGHDNIVGLIYKK